MSCYVVFDTFPKPQIAIDKGVSSQQLETLRHAPLRMVKQARFYLEARGIAYAFHACKQGGVAALVDGMTIVCAPHQASIRPNRQRISRGKPDKLLEHDGRVRPSVLSRANYERLFL